MRHVVLFMVLACISSPGNAQAFDEVEILLRIGFFENTNSSFVLGSTKNDLQYEFDIEENISSSVIELGAKISFLENHSFVVGIGKFSNGQILSGIQIDEMQNITEVRPLVTNYKYLNFRIGHEVILPFSDSWSFYFQNALLLQTLTNGATIKAVDINNLNYSYAGEMGIEIKINDYFNFNIGMTMFRYLKGYEKDTVVGEFKPISYGLLIGFGYIMSESYR